MKSTHPLVLFAAFVALMAGTAAQAATTLHDCFAAPQSYSYSFAREMQASANIANNPIHIGDHIIGSGGEMEANCACPMNISESSAIYALSLAGSPLPPGTAGYGYLTENIDIDVAGYTDAINNPDGIGLLQLAINEYPTPLASMKKQVDRMKPTQGTAGVCSDSTRPGTSTAKRQFKWNVIAADFYIKKPILGVEVIPQTLVLQNYACLYFGTGSCDTSYAQQVSNFWIGGTLSAPLSCTINAGSAIEVEFGQLVASQFVTRGQTPEGFTLKDVDIRYHCDSNAIDNSARIKLTLSADQGVVDGSNAFIAKTVDRDDLGVRIFTENSQNVALDGSYEFPVAMDEQGNGVVRIKAAPVSTTRARPAAGGFESNVTVKMDLR